MLIDRIHKTVRILANTDGRGNAKREHIDLLVHNVVLEKFEELLFDVNRLINRQNRGLINGALENTTDRVREKIQHYLDEKSVSITNTTFLIPSEVRYFDTVFYQERFIELCKNNKEFLIYAETASLDNPIGLKTNKVLKVKPTTITDITISYLRNPIPAKWTYSVINGEEFFNPSKSDFKDVDIHASEEDDVVIRVLQKLGINLKEKDLQAINQEIKNEFNEKNQN